MFVFAPGLLRDGKNGCRHVLRPGRGLWRTSSAELRQRWAMDLNSESPAVERLKVLIVDDHPMVREGLAGILRRFEIAISGVAASGREALEMFSATRPDVTLLDLRLPDQRGLDVLKSIFNLDPMARVVILTSSHANANTHIPISLPPFWYLLNA